MKKCMILCVFMAFCLGCMEPDDLFSVKLGTFTDSYRPANWTDEEYQVFREWFDQLQNSFTEDKIVHNMDELQPYIQYGLLDDAAITKVNFDKHVVFTVLEGLVPAKGVTFHESDMGGVVAYFMTYDQTSPDCCKDNCPPENANLKDKYYSIYAVDKKMTDGLILRAKPRCE